MLITRRNLHTGNGTLDPNRIYLRRINFMNSFSSLTGGALFSFGSVLIWAVLKSTLPKDQGLVATVAGLASGFAIVKLTTDYFAHVDGIVAKK